MEVKGKIKFIGPDEQVSASFVKRDMVVTTDEQFPQHILIQFMQDKVELLDQYKPGDEVSVSINLRGREWVNPQGETKYFNTIQGWKISSVGAAYTARQNTAQAAAPETAQQNAVSPPAQQEDDLLF